MPYVTVPKDFANVQPKVIAGMTNRQIIAAAAAAAVCLPLYFFVRPVLGDFALWLMIVLSVPIFLLGFYRHRDGRPPEKVLVNFIRVRYCLPAARPYQTECIYTHMALANQIEEIMTDANNQTQTQKGQAPRPIRRAAKGRAQKGHTAH